jgi:hypothetical protein
MQFMTHKLLNLFFYSNAMEDKLPTYDASSTNLFFYLQCKNTLYYVLFNFLNLSVSVPCFIIALISSSVILPSEEGLIFRISNKTLYYWSTK